MPPQYRIVDINSFWFEELLMANHFMFNPENKLGRNLYEFYKKYFLNDYQFFLKQVVNLLPAANFKNL